MTAMTPMNSHSQVLDYNEPGSLAMECLTDADGDGYAYGSFAACYTLDLVDS